MVTARDLTAARAVVKLGLASPGTAVAAITELAGAEDGPTLVQKLVGMGAIDGDQAEQVRSLVNLHDARTRDGILLELMKGTGRFTPEELAGFSKAVSAPGQTRQLGDLLVESGKINAAERKNAEANCLQQWQALQSKALEEARAGAWAVAGKPLSTSPAATPAAAPAPPPPPPAAAAPPPPPKADAPPPPPAPPTADIPAVPKAEAKPPEPAKPKAAKPVAAPKPDAKPEAKAKPDTKADAKPEAKAKPAAKADAKPDAKPAAKSDAKAKPDAKSGAKPDAKAKPAAKTAASDKEDGANAAPTITAESVIEGTSETLDTSGMILPEGAEILPPEAWASFDIFSDIPSNNVIKFLERTVKTSQPQHPIWIRRYKQGEIICHEGEHGSTAFYIVKGEVDIFISSLLRKKEEEARQGFFSRLFSRKAKRQPSRRFIPIDASVDLDTENPIATIPEGNIFGEQTAMSFTPRSATVRAKTDVVCFEMLRSVLSDLLQRRSKKFKAKLEAAYRNNALKNHLGAVPVFKDLPESFLEELKNQVELVGPFAKGEVICKQGEPSDAFYLIRMGFVKVTQKHPGGEVVLAYLGRGSYFGEIGILDGSPRTATCVALDSVELVRISRANFMRLTSKFPDIRSKLREDAMSRKKEGKEVVEVAPTVALDEFLDQGLMNAQNVLLIDLEKCTRCDECVRACADVHDGVSRFVRDGLRFDRYLVASACRSCSDPLCMMGCPVGSILRRGSLEIRIEDWCIGCGKCANQCPYGNITMHDIPLDGAPGKPFKAETCDLCGDVGGDPNCVYACPHDAAVRVEPRDYFETRFVGR